MNHEYYGRLYFTLREEFEKEFPEFKQRDFYNVGKDEIPCLSSSIEIWKMLEKLKFRTGKSFEDAKLTEKGKKWFKDNNFEEIDFMDKNFNMK